MNSRTVAIVYKNTLKKNFNILSSHSSRVIGSKYQGAVPMVKANAYGHGLIEVAKILQKDAHCLAFGVATLDEALQLRAHKVKTPIWIFSGTSPLTDELVRAVLKHQCVPVISSAAGVRKALRVASKNKQFRFHIKWDTGMHRLGIDFKQAEEIKKLIKHFVQKNKFVPVVGLCMHFAQSLKDHSHLTKLQSERFRKIVKLFKEFRIPFIHSANSGAILSKNHCNTSDFCTVVRPGIGVYGYLGKKGYSIGLRPALQWKTQVLHAKILHKGDYVGYDGTYRSKSTESQNIIGLGYGDGLHRILSNKWIMISTNNKNMLKKSKIQGRISMDLTSLHEKYREGDWITVLGDHPKQAESMAKLAQTNEYELLTSIQPRVKRIYR